MADDRKLVEENQHLLPPSERTIVQRLGEDEMEVDVAKVKKAVEKRRAEIEAGDEGEEMDSDLEEELSLSKQKAKGKKMKMKVGGGVEKMDIDA